MKGLFSLFGFVLAFVTLCVYPPDSQAQVFGRNRTQVNINNGGSKVQVNARNGFRNQSQVNVINNAPVPFIPNAVRVNTFGSRTVVDGFGNVFEVNSFGQPVIRSNSFRGFGVNSFGGFSVPHRCF
jgi:hypothetical protein